MSELLIDVVREWAIVFQTILHVSDFHELKYFLLIDAMRSVLLCYGSMWDKTNYVYNGGILKGMLLQPTAAFSALKENVYVVT